MKTLSRFILHVFHDYFFPRQLAFGVYFLNLFGDKKYCQMLHEKINKCQPNTVGHALRLFMKKPDVYRKAWRFGLLGSMVSGSCPLDGFSRSRSFNFSNSYWL